MLLCTCLALIPHVTKHAKTKKTANAANNYVIIQQLSIRSVTTLVTVIIART